MFLGIIIKFRTEMLLQAEAQPIDPTNAQETSDTIFTVVGIFLVMILIWVTIKGKLRDWLMK